MNNFDVTILTPQGDNRVKLIPTVNNVILETTQSCPGFYKNIEFELSNETLEQLRAWIEDYFKTKNEKIQKQQDHNRKLFENELLCIKTGERMINPSITAFVSVIAEYFNFTYSPRAVATLRNSVQVCWKNDDAILIMEFLYVPQSTPLVIWEIRDKEGQYCSEGRIATHGDYIEKINKLVETFYNPLTAGA